VDYVVRSRGAISTLVTFSLFDDSAEEEDDDQEKTVGNGKRGVPEHNGQTQTQFLLWGLDNCVGVFVNHHPDKKRRNVRLIRTQEDVQTVQQLARLDHNYFWFQACQDIAAGSELFCDYGSTFFSPKDKVLA
jgi:hypothetical protein